MTTENTNDMTHATAAATPPPAILTDDAASTSSPASVSSTPSAASTALSVKDRIRLMNLGKNRMLLQEAAVALEGQKQQQQQQQTSESLHDNKDGANDDNDNHDDDDNASVATHNTHGTHGSSRRAFASDSSWIGRRAGANANASANASSGTNAVLAAAVSASMTSGSSTIPTSIKFGDMKKKVREHKVKTAGSSNSSEQDGSTSSPSSNNNNSAGNHTDGTGSGTAADASTANVSQVQGQVRPGKLKVPAAFLTGGGSNVGVISPLSTTSTPSTNDNNSNKTSHIAPPPSRKEAMLLERKKKMDAAIKVAPPAAPAPAPSTALAHADERRRLLEKRRKIRQKVKATQQLQHQRAMEAAERNRARTEIVEVPSAASASAESAEAAAAPKLLSPASECSIECIFKDEAAPPLKDGPSDEDNTDTDQQPTAIQKPPAPPLPSRPLSLRTDPMPQAIAPPNSFPIGVLSDEAAAVDPTSPPRVTRSPMTGALRPTLDDTDASALPSLELSPIRGSQNASFDKSSEISITDKPTPNASDDNAIGDSPSLRGRGSADGVGFLPPHASTPEKSQQQGIAPSRDNTPKITNRAPGMQRTSSSGMLSHPVSVLPKDLPSGKTRKKPAGLPLSPTKTSDASHASGTIPSNAESQSLVGSSKSSPTAPSFGVSLQSSELARLGAASTTTQEPVAEPKAESAASPSTTNTNDTGTQSDTLLNTSDEGDSLLSWLGKQSDNDTATLAREEELLKSVENVEATKKGPLSVRSSCRSTRSQSLDVISECQSHHSEKDVASPPSSASSEKQHVSVPRPVPNQEAGIGSFISMISSAYNGLKIDNALDGVMEVVAEGVDKGYREMSHITTSFLDGPGPTKQRLQQQYTKNVQKGSEFGPKSPGMGPIQIEISRSFNPRIIAYDNDENATADGSRVSALTFETYEDYISMTSMSPARATSTTNRRTPRGLQMAYSEDTASNKDGRKGGGVPTVKEEQNWQPFEKERRFFA